MSNPASTHSRTEMAHAIRLLAMDAVQQANSGHPGMPMGMADIAEVLWNDALRHNPANPGWPNRDRFVLSNGHGSMLLYAALYLSGYDLTRADIEAFRQLHSRTPGHPEYGVTPGVETTTGPLGQGLANAVGMAIAEASLAAGFNRDGFPLVDHHTYAFAGDGCLMEGVSHEACSLAGTLGLGRLIVFYDDNGISIDGQVHGWFTDDTPARFEAYGWQVVRNVDGHSPEEIRLALATARAETQRPTLVCCRTIIGYGSPNFAGKERAHGGTLGADEIRLTREQLQWAHDAFDVPEAMRMRWNARERGAAWEAEWNELFSRYEAAHPELAAEFTRRMERRLPADWAAFRSRLLETALAQVKPNATRKDSKAVLDLLAAELPETLGGSADLSESNGTDFKGHKPLRASDMHGNYLQYGVREFAMGAIVNGLWLHGGVRPFGATFLVFSDYARNAVRLSALMKLPVAYVFTHDSIAVGEDGPTHQPVEHLASLRLIPNLEVWRPADALETAVAWLRASERTDGPVVLALTRQNLPPLGPDPARAGPDGAARGGYVVFEPEAGFDRLIVATGSEVALAVEAAKKLADEGVGVRVVSMPCAELFLKQDAAWQEAVLPRAVTRRLAVEAGSSLYWRAFTGFAGDVLGIDTFGESAPGPKVMELFGFTAANVAARARALA